MNPIKLNCDAKKKKKIYELSCKRPVQGRPAQRTVVNQAQEMPIEGIVFDQAQEMPIEGIVFDQVQGRPVQGTVVNQFQGMPVQGILPNNSYTSTGKQCPTGYRDTPFEEIPDQQPSKKYGIAQGYNIPCYQNPKRWIDRNFMPSWYIDDPPSRRLTGFTRFLDLIVGGNANNKKTRKLLKREKTIKRRKNKKNRKLEKGRRKTRK